MAMIIKPIPRKEVPVIVTEEMVNEWLEKNPVPALITKLNNGLYEVNAGNFKWYMGEHLVNQLRESIVKNDTKQ